MCSTPNGLRLLVQAQLPVNNASSNFNIASTRLWLLLSLSLSLSEALWQAYHMHRAPPFLSRHDNEIYDFETGPPGASLRGRSVVSISKVGNKRDSCCCVFL